MFQALPPEPPLDDRNNIQGGVEQGGTASIAALLRAGTAITARRLGCHGVSS